MCYLALPCSLTISGFEAQCQALPFPPTEGDRERLQVAGRGPRAEISGPGCRGEHSS